MEINMYVVVILLAYKAIITTIFLKIKEIILSSNGAPARSRTADLLITNQLLKSNLTFVSNNNLEIF